MMETKRDIYSELIEELNSFKKKAMWVNGVKEDDGLIRGIAASIMVIEQQREQDRLKAEIKKLGGKN